MEEQLLGFFNLFQFICLLILLKHKISTKKKKINVFKKINLAWNPLFQIDISLFLCYNKKKNRRKNKPLDSPA